MPSRSWWAALRVVDDDLGRVVAVLAHLVPRPVLGQLGGGEVAHVLVEPVGGEAGDEAHLPPLLLLHLLDPGARDVPVVRHVVVVDDHRGRDRREEPADERVGPRLAVEVRVLLEVEDLLARLLRRVAARADELARLRRALVDVDLVAEQEQEVRPAAVRVADELLGEDVERVDLAALVVLVLGVGVRRLVRDGHAARAERDAEVRVLGDACGCREAAGRSRVRARRRSPSSFTSYAFSEPGSRSWMQTSA